MRNVRPSARTDCRSGGGEAEEPLGTGMSRKFSLARNHISDKQRDKENERRGNEI